MTVTALHIHITGSLETVGKRAKGGAVFVGRPFLNFKHKLLCSVCRKRLNVFSCKLMKRPTVYLPLPIHTAGCCWFAFCTNSDCANVEVQSFFLKYFFRKHCMNIYVKSVTPIKCWSFAHLLKRLNSILYKLQPLTLNANMSMLSLCGLIQRGSIDMESTVQYSYATTGPHILVFEITFSKRNLIHKLT